MILKNRKDLKNAAGAALRRAPGSPKKIALIYSGVILGVSFILVLLSYFVNRTMANMGGLSAMAAQAMASSVLQMLSITVTFLTPIWSAGFLVCALKWARQEETVPKDLLAGLGRFLPLLRLILSKLLMTVAVALISAYAAGMLFFLTPLSNGTVNLVAPYVTEEIMADPALIMQYLQPEQLLLSMAPFFLLLMAAFAFLYYIFLYRLRFAEYFILDRYTDRARAAMAMSTRILRTRKKDLLMLDLSFWWYYAATAGLTLVSNLDTILSLWGVKLPFDPAISYFVPYILYIAGTLLLDIHALPYIQTVYAKAYCDLSQPQEDNRTFIEGE